LGLRSRILLALLLTAALPGVEELIGRADTALFKAQQGGRNKVQLWNAELAVGKKEANERLEKRLSFPQFCRSRLYNA